MEKVCSIARHPMRREKKAGSIQWPSFTGTAQLVGTTTDGRVSVYVDPSLGAPALKNAKDLLTDAPRIVAANDELFGTKSGHTDVIVFALGGATDGTGGADHMACDYVNGAQIEVDAAFGASARCSALFEAELSECSMGGNLCGKSTGESLSRWCANTTSPHALDDFASGPTWAADGMADWVTQVENTDQDYDSIGCGMVFISWLISLGHKLSNIAPVMVKLGDGGTLAALYAALTGDTAANALSKFMSAVNGLKGGVTSDDPFAGTTPVPPPVPPPPAPGPTTKTYTITGGTITLVG